MACCSGHLCMGMFHSWEQWNEFLAVLEGVEGVQHKGWGERCGPGCVDVTRAWVGPQEVCRLLHGPLRPLQGHELSKRLITAWCQHFVVDFRGSKRNVTIKCVNISCGEFISRVLASQGCSEEDPWQNTAFLKAVLINPTELFHFLFFFLSSAAVWSSSHYLGGKIFFNTVGWGIFIMFAVGHI